MIATAEWDDLSDSELRSRLVKRGVDPLVARRLVRHRERTGARTTIERVLQGSRRRAKP